MRDYGLDDILVPSSVERHGSATPPATLGEVERDPEWLKFEHDVRTALRNQKRVALADINAGRQPSRITVLSIQRESKRSRSQLYKSHDHFRRLISCAQAAVERLVKRRAEKANVEVEPSLSALKVEIRRLRAENRNLVATNASEQATTMFASMFPREGERAQAEIVRLKAELQEKETLLQAARAFNERDSSWAPFPRRVPPTIDEQPDE